MSIAKEITVINLGRRSKAIWDLQTKAIYDALD